MKKIRLDLDALDVVSFRTTGADAEARGTVHGHRPPYTEGLECDSIDFCTNLDCGTAVSECGGCTGPTGCGTCATNCGSCYDATCGNTYCGTCATNCGTCDPYCCCSCSCC
ncbi:MAG TPA: hypothetical protein VFY65_06690 [Longimicrobium sp.]|nr:hypothetical protein [Longimicrobium sp.]